MKNFRCIAYSNVKDGLLYRGESIYHLSGKDRKYLLDECNIKTIIDLRTNQERADKPDKDLPGVINIHLPMITMEEMGVSSEKQLKSDVLKNHKLPDILEYYRRLVSPARKDVWTKIFEILLDNNGSGIFFHCTVGKDRTGVVSAVILSALGVDKEAIYKDYLETNDHPVIPFAYKVFARFLDKEFRKEFMEYFSAKKEYIDAAFEEIDHSYGSMDGFLRECCNMDGDKLKALKEKYLKAEQL